jgi:uncharacterized phiE125 gp8 family phage protein
MWYPATVTVAASEPVTIEQARLQARSEVDTDLDAELTRLITVARNHVEKICGVRLGTQTIVVRCDCFDDMARLPDAPVQSVTSIQYVDTAGDTQTLATSVYELRADGIEASIILKYGQAWPATQSGSRITLTAVVGFSAPEPAHVHAMLLFIAEQFSSHEPVEIAGMTTLDALLINHRRGV